MTAQGSDTSDTVRVCPKEVPHPWGSAPTRSCSGSRRGHGQAQGSSPNPSQQPMTVTTCPPQAGAAISQPTQPRVPSWQLSRSGRRRRAHAISVNGTFTTSRSMVPQGAPSRGAGSPRARQHQKSSARTTIPLESWGPGVCTPLPGAGRRPSSSRLGSAGDPASSLCSPTLRHLPLLLFAPLDVPVRLDDAGSLLLHDAPASHRHRRCQGCRALAQARREEEPLPSSLWAETGPIREDRDGESSEELSPRG